MNELEYNFYISPNGRLIENFYDINFLFSPAESDIPAIPETDEVSVKIAGRDGDMVLSTMYAPLSFKIVAYTDENLTASEKTAEIVKLTTFLNTIKNKTRQFAIVQEEKMYAVKYSGQLTITRYPKSVRFEIPLKCSRAFGTALTSTTITGSGTETSDTIEPTGCIITINGPANIPTISLNDYQMKYDNVVLAGNSLIINTNDSTIKHVNGTTGQITNAAIYYNHEYPKIVNGENEIEIISGISDETQVVTEWYDLKL